jgi:hypothetical protein
MHTYTTVYIYYSLLYTFVPPLIYYLHPPPPYYYTTMHYAVKIYECESTVTDPTRYREDQTLTT